VRQHKLQTACPCSSASKCEQNSSSCRLSRHDILDGPTCQWNTFLCENYGCFRSSFRSLHYKDLSTAERIKKFTQCNELWTALSDFDGRPSTYSAVNYIRVVVKQLTRHTQLALTNAEASALTEATTKAMKLTCDYMMCPNSTLYERRDGDRCVTYSRTFKFQTERKFQVLNSSGKHTNAVLCFVSWMIENIKDFVEKERISE